MYAVWFMMCDVWCMMCDVWCMMYDIWSVVWWMIKMNSHIYITLHENYSVSSSLMCWHVCSTILEAAARSRSTRRYRPRLVRSSSKTNNTFNSHARWRSKTVVIISNTAGPQMSCFVCAMCKYMREFLSLCRVWLYICRCWSLSLSLCTAHVYIYIIIISIINNISL